MWQWVQDNAQVLSGLGTLLMAAIWAVYLHMLVWETRQHRRPRILVQEIAGPGSQPAVMIVNLSGVSMQVEAVMVEAEVDGEAHTHAITDFENVAARSENPGQPSGTPGGGSGPASGREVVQGPLQPGGYLILGSFARLVRAALPDEWPTIRTARDESDKEQAREGEGADNAGEKNAAVEIPVEIPVEIRVIALHGGTTRPVAACRRFHVSLAAGGGRVEPESLQTRMLSSFRTRRMVRRWLLESTQVDGAATQWKWAGDKPSGRRQNESDERPDRGRSE